MEEGLVEYLKADATLASLLGGRIYPGAAPKSATGVRVVYNRLSTGRLLVLDGPSGLPTARMQLDTWGPSAASVRAVVRRLLVLLNGTTGEWGDYYVSCSQVEEQQTDHERPEDASDRGEYRETLDVLVSYDEGE